MLVVIVRRHHLCCHPLLKGELGDELEQPYSSAALPELYLVDVNL